MSRVLAGLVAPVVGAPMAGGPSTVALAAAVSGAGGLGVLAGANLAVDVLAGRVRELRESLGQRSFGVNLFLPTAEPPLLDLAAHLAALDRWAVRYDVRRGAATWDDDGWRGKVDVLLADPAPVVTFHFGCPPHDVVDALHGVGSEVWTTVTSRTEACTATAGGVDALIVQGREAGGHRGTFSNDATSSDPDDEPGLLALLRLVSAVTELPLVAAGGLVHGADVAAVLVAGAAAAQCGSAFLGCPEAGTSGVHRAVAAADRPTAVTRAFSGRPARAARNALLDELSAGAPAAYPHLNRASAPIRTAAAAADDESAVALWAGQTHHLARVLPAADVVALLVAEAREALAAGSSRLG